MKSTDTMRLLPDEVHIHTILIGKNKHRLDSYSQLLSPQELQKAEVFRFDYDKDIYILGRGALRLLLSEHLDKDPQSISIQYGPFGKPYFAETPELKFNLSHSRGLICIAFTHISDIGIDIEYQNLQIDHLEVGQNVFSPRELSYINTGSEPIRIDRFFKLWTRKEAFIKALGYGFSMPIDLKKINVLEQKVEFLKNSIDHSDSIDPNWVLHSFEPEPGYKAAIAIRKLPSNISYHQDLGH